MMLATLAAVREAPWRHIAEQLKARRCRRQHRSRVSDEVMSEWSDEETDDPLYADERNFDKVEKWTFDGSKVERLLYKAQEIFAKAVKHRPRHNPAADARLAAVAKPHELNG
jgi:hypothetical protein